MPMGWAVAGTVTLRLAGRRRRGRGWHYDSHADLRLGNFTAAT
jgi:hypothetical protein